MFRRKSTGNVNNRLQFVMSIDENSESTLNRKPDHIKIRNAKKTIKIKRT